MKAVVFSGFSGFSSYDVDNVSVDFEGAGGLDLPVFTPSSLRRSMPAWLVLPVTADRHRGAHGPSSSDRGRGGRLPRYLCPWCSTCDFAASAA